jgi:hypothetical protein
VAGYDARLQAAVEAERSHYQDRLKPAMDRRDALAEKIRTIEAAGQPGFGQRRGGHPVAAEQAEKLPKLKGEAAEAQAELAPLTARWYGLRLSISGAKSALQRATGLVNAGAMETAAHELLDGRASRNAHPHKENL